MQREIVESLSSNQRLQGANQMNRKEQWAMLAKLMDLGITEDEAVEAVEKTQGTQMVTIASSVVAGEYTVTLAHSESQLHYYVTYGKHVESFENMAHAFELYIACTQHQLTCAGIATTEEE
jgi:Fe2+ transport system protein FeoA